MPSHAFDIAILGGGASGALVAAHLHDRAGERLRVAVVEPRGELALGTAYSTARDEHLLNVPAGKMSAFDARPGDFVDFLRTQPEACGEDAAALAGRYMPRRLYGRYLRHALESQPRHSGLQHVEGRAIDAQRVDGGFEVGLESGDALRAMALVLALGNRPARLPALADGARVVDAWDYPAVAAIPPDADVAIVGAGLSMVDAVLTLDANGHRGRIDALSRHGLPPLGHVASAAPARPGLVESLLPLDLRRRLRRLRGEAASAMAAGQPWQWTMDALRPHVQALWTSLPEVEQRRFLRHCVRQWDIHRHRIAPEVAQVLERLRAQGRLRIHAGRLLEADAQGLRWQPRGGGGERRIDARVVVNATGMEKNALRAPGLLAAMHARGLLQPGPHGIGLASAGDGAVLDAGGAVVPGLWTLGPSRVGSLWESIAIPELRGQAERVAAAARAHVAGNAAS